MANFKKMAKFIQFSWLLLLVTIIACNEPGSITGANGQVEKTESCQSNPHNTYEVYIPELKPTKDKLPLLVIIDANGAGKFALNKFKLAAREYPVILAASNYVKNGVEDYEIGIQELIQDVKQKYPANNTVYLAGFSGGARMAVGYGLAHPVNGMILCGALAKADQIMALKCPVFSISGLDDFNFVETAQFIFNDESAPKNLSIELNNASHSWPDSLLLSNTFGFLYLSSDSEEMNMSSNEKVEAYCKNQLLRIDRLTKQDDLMKAALIARNMALKKPFSNDEIFMKSWAEIKSNPDYNAQLSKIEQGLSFEMSARQPYLEAFTNKDSLWWKNEITSLEKKINSEQDPYTVAMYKRIKGFWGIACYSIGNRTIKLRDVNSLKKIMTVYRMLEPENPYVLYFSAFPAYWKGETGKTEKILKSAINAGFSDWGRLNEDFPRSVTSALN